MEDFCRYKNTQSIGTFSFLALDNLEGDRPDVHWHAFDSNLTVQVVIAASSLSGTRIQFLRYWRPELAQTIGDILVAYQIVGRSQPSEAAHTLTALHARQRDAMDRISAAITSEARSLAAREESAGSRIRTYPLIKPFAKEPEHCFVAQIPEQMMAFVTPKMIVEVTEDDRALGPGDALHQSIRDHGSGAFSVWGQKVYLSSSDRTDCNDNGRRYEIVARETKIS